jgi:hypothetical protein
MRIRYHRRPQVTRHAIARTICHRHRYLRILKSCLPFSSRRGASTTYKASARRELVRSKSIRHTSSTSQRLRPVARDSFSTTLELFTGILYHSFCLMFGRRGSGVPVLRLLSIHSHRTGLWPPIVAPRYGRQQVSHIHTFNSLWRSSVLPSVLVLSNTGRVGRYRSAKLGSEAEEPLSEP